MLVKARFLEGGRGRIFALMRRPQAAVGAGVLIVPPFAEEMNKTRRMLTDVAQALQTCGVASVVADPYGTGDSEGEFRDATCAGWVDDLARVAAWSAAEGWPIAGLLCVRFGCLLGARLARDALSGVRCTVFWEPVVDGERLLSQFLRLRVAASMTDSARVSVAGLREALRAGQCLQVAGYDLSPALAGELTKLKLADLLGGHLGTLHWMEVVGDAARPVTAAARQLEELMAGGLRVTMQRIVGPPFWTSTEIVQIRELIDRTVAAFCAPAALAQVHVA